MANEQLIKPSRISHGSRVKMVIVRVAWVEIQFVSWQVILMKRQCVASSY